MAGTGHYLIRGGVPGRERLRIVSRVMRPSTIALLERAGLQPGMIVWEAGCGGGDVAFEIARLIATKGYVIATDVDDAKLALARTEAMEQNFRSIEFRFGDVLHDAPYGPFDLVHARFLLTHLRYPDVALRNMWRSLRPGGTVVVEDVDFGGYFCHPPHDPFWRYVDLYTRTAAKKGGDANIGPRLPSLLAGTGFVDVQMNVVQHASTTGEVKLLSPLTMENIANSVVAEGLADRAEVDRIIAALYEFADTPGTIGCTPRIFEAWAHRPLT
jgi:SAM-dependent methyltransferase